MMGVTLRVKNPENIETIAEVEDILMRLGQYEREFKHTAAVGLLQNMQLGGSYRIGNSEEIQSDVAANCARPYGKVEWYVEFCPREYFEELKARLEGSAA